LISTEFFISSTQSLESFTPEKSTLLDESFQRSEALQFSISYSSDRASLRVARCARRQLALHRAKRRRAHQCMASGDAGNCRSCLLATRLPRECTSDA
jgi:hypothetical protein